MNTGMDKKIEVWADWFDDGKPQKVGVLCSFVTRGKEIFSFEYDPLWLKGSCKLQLDPKLKLFKGAHIFISVMMTG